MTCFLHLSLLIWEMGHRIRIQWDDRHGAWAPRGSLTRSFTWVLLRCHFSLGFEGVNTDTSLPSSSKMLELSCLMTWGRTEAGRWAGSSPGLLF